MCPICCAFFLGSRGEHWPALVSAGDAHSFCVLGANLSFLLPALFTWVFYHWCALTLVRHNFELVTIWAIQYCYLPCCPFLPPPGDYCVCGKQMVNFTLLQLFPVFPLENVWACHLPLYISRQEGNSRFLFVLCPRIHTCMQNVPSWKDLSLCEWFSWSPYICLVEEWSSLWRRRQMPPCSFIGLAT